jgi:hypothetical protein
MQGNLAACMPDVDPLVPRRIVMAGATLAVTDGYSKLE